MPTNAGVRGSSMQPGESAGGGGGGGTGDDDGDRRRRLEEALLLQMDMQKKLHEQLEVRCGGVCGLTGCLHVWAALTGALATPLLECCIMVAHAPACTRKSLNALPARFPHPRTLQAQRQLQLSLEAHSRYITSLLEGSDLRHRLSSGQGGSAATSSAALEAANPEAAEGSKAEQQQAQQGASAAQQQQAQHAGGGSPRKQQQQAQGKQAPRAESGAAGAPTAGTGSLTAFHLPATTVGSVHAPSAQPLSPGSLIEGGAAEGALAAAWDAASLPNKLEAAAAGVATVEVQVVAAPPLDAEAAAAQAEAATKRQRTG